jgi:hypothetical protein
MEMIYKLMLAMIFLLSKEIPLEQLYEKDNMCKLKKVAEAIHYNAIYVDRYDYNMALTLVALGFVESRYGVTEEGLVISKRGACGIFQIMPRYTEYSCIEYFDLITSAMVATRIVKQIKDTCTLKDKDACLCHYNSGNKCYGSSRKYANLVSSFKSQIVEEIFIKPQSLLNILFIHLFTQDCSILLDKNKIPFSIY